MRVILSVMLCLLPCIAHGQAGDPLAVTLPSGKIVHFPTAEAKAKFENAQIKLKSSSAMTTTASPPRDVVRDEFQKALAEKKAQEELDAKTQAFWCRIIEIHKDGVIVTMGRAGYPWSNQEYFISCEPNNKWADGTVFFAHVYSDGTKRDAARTATYNNFRLNGPVKYQ